MGDSFQVTIKGFIKDVITQMKRDLSGFWVAHPDFVRLGMALVEGWKQRVNGHPEKLETLITSLLDKKYHREILDFVNGPDIQGLNVGHALYPRALLVADIKESNFIANNHPDEIRYNVFQSLQYLTDWLSGNGCVALPAQIEGVPVRVMDDLATAERSRWEVWHELHHGRFALDEFLKIAHEEMLFIRKDLSDDKKIVQVKWDERTARWYPIALKLMLQLMTAKKPVEFASELLLPFTVESIRAAKDPWAAACTADPGKYQLEPYIERFDYYFSACGSLPFARAMAKDLVTDLTKAESLIQAFDLLEVIAAAGFHGDIGESAKTLDATASTEQALVLKESDSVKDGLRKLGADYKKKFGVKFLISAKDKPAAEILTALESRIKNSEAQELDNARAALWQITHKRLAGADNLQTKISALLKKHSVHGAQIALTTGAGPQTLCFGDSVPGQKVTPETYFELASLSKTIAAAYALEYFASENIPLNQSVNELFADTATDFRIAGVETADQVALAHLMNHTALNLHYVNGVPANRPMVKTKDLLDGNTDYGYEPVRALHPPGTKFSYSGGGFLVLEHLLESLERREIQDQTARFLSEFPGLTFQQQTLPNHNYAHGFLADGREVEGTRKMFPAFAAGAMGTAAGMLEFLEALGRAYRDLDGSRGISHDTSVRMLHGTDLSTRTFMGADMGLGVFTLDGGPNRFALHQGANDGFRALFVHCYDGPDAGEGFVILCNADTNGVAFVAEAAQLILRQFAFTGVNPARFKDAFDARTMPPEKAVNYGYKEMIFGAFEPAMPEEIAEKGPVDPLAEFNLAAGAEVLECSNQKFARAENLLSKHLPVFDPGLFGAQGKIMDSWETVRHNPKSHDTLVLKLKRASALRYISLSTQFHFGNQAQFVRLEGLAGGKSEWQEILPKTPLEGHALKRVLSADTKTIFEKIRVSLYPDGGFTRLGLYGDTLPESETKKFSSAGSVTFSDKIPQAIKPLTPHFQTSPEEIKKSWGLMSKGEEADFASAAFGGKVLGATNEHYGPAAQVISPLPPINMFDGFESARSRDQDHFEEIRIQLAKPVRVTRIQVDFTYFPNNNPRELSVTGIAAGRPVKLVAKTPVKAFAGNKIEFNVEAQEKIEAVTVTVFPDGGMNRVHVFGVIE